MKMSRNGLLDLYYVTDEYRPMSSMFVGINADTLTQIEKIFMPDSSGYDKFKNTMKYIGGTEFNISSPVGDFNDTVFRDYGYRN